MLSDLKRLKLTRYFEMYDIDDDGVVDRRDFERIIENVRFLHGVPQTSPVFTSLQAAYMDQWHALMVSADIDENGSVDPDEWVAYFTGVIGDQELYEAAVTNLVFGLLSVFDTNGDGVLGADEFVNFYGLFGRSAALARQVFIELDRDFDGKISMEELMVMAEGFFRSDDPDAPGNSLFGPLED